MNFEGHTVLCVADGWDRVTPIRRQKDPSQITHPELVFYFYHEEQDGVWLMEADNETWLAHAIEFARNDLKSHEPQHRGFCTGLRALVRFQRWRLTGQR